MTATSRTIDVLADDRRDRALIKQFLAHLARQRGRIWTSLDYPEEWIHSREAVQVSAMEENGGVTAIEHVALDGFADDPLTAAFAALEHDPSLSTSGLYVDVAVPTEGLSSAIDTTLLVTSVKRCCERHIRNGREGRFTQVVMVSRAPLKLQLEITACPGEPGRLSVTRAQPPRNFEAVVHDRLQEKLPRLIAAAADRRVLLFEKSDVLWSLAQLRLELEGASLEFPELNAITESWLADTTDWRTNRSAVFRLVLQNNEE